jgi:anhydro-N-acetylmuramic acid kinase
MLRPLQDRKSLVVLGLNSGTSADGLDLAVVKIAREAAGRSGANRCRLLAGHTVRYPDQIRRLILAAADIIDTPINEIIRLDNLLGQFYGRTARAFIARLAKKGITVDAVASHGQTVRHLPRPTTIAGYTVRGTLQLGSLAQIATLTGRVTVGDFRQGDIALGGEGAPITPAAMAELFADRAQARLIVNVGGMSNYFFLPAGRSAGGRAADCGPGNVLSDFLCHRLFHEPFDRDGRHASRGRVSQRLLSMLMASPFFSRRQRSTGREEFGEAMADRMISAGKKIKLTSNDLVATATELTVVSIAAAVRSLTPLIRRNAISRRGTAAGRTAATCLYLTGGGSHNKFLSARLSERLRGMPVSTIRDLGMDPDLVEAAAYAVMGAGTFWSRPLRTQFDGRRQKRQAVLGMICQPPRKVYVRK